ncbi:MAG: GH116 family glycosyl-hydrolase [Endozoicomonas sp.]
MQNWPVLRQYQGKYLRRIAMPLGGIGTGSVSLGGRGNLQDWAIMNSPAIGYTPNIMQGMFRTGPFFALYTETEGVKKTTVLEGLLDPETFEASEGSEAVNHGLPRFRQCRFEAAYPLAQVKLQDDDVPLEVTLKAFNPLIPGDSEQSGIPVAVLTYRLKNNTNKPVSASVCGTVINCVGADGRRRGKIKDQEHRFAYLGSKGNKNVFRQQDNLSGIYMDSDKVSRKSRAWGNLALTTCSQGEVSYRTGWAEKTWGDSTLDFWDDFSENGVLTERNATTAPFTQMASLAVKNELAPGEETDVTFLLTWHFPNRKTWIEDHLKYPVQIGNYYTTQYMDAWDVAARTAHKLPALETKTVSFATAFCHSDLPLAVKEAALFNISTLRTQTCFRTPDGRFFGWEGIHDSYGSCFGSCTHVWNYEQATAFLFGDLARSMRETEFLKATARDGHMNFRVLLPLLLNTVYRFPAAADGQMGCIMKVYREWQLSGDRSFLEKLWPATKKTLEFCWLKGGWDADQDGVMEGCQHNTMDVEYYGPNPQMQGWYLGALRAAEEMAREMGDDAFAEHCSELFLKGSRYMDEKLFNGEYYEHIIQVPAKIKRGLTADMGATDLSNPILQLGAGCLVDQLVGQYMAHVLGLGYLVSSENVRKSLQSIMKYNFKEGFHDHFNHMRSYVLNDESALLMATYPRGQRPEQPFPYYNEVMTGFEHSTAAHMLYEGMHDDGLKVIQSIRERYDGFKRNPFDEAECGHHYARAMAAWSQVLALTGFQYSGIQQEMKFAANEGTFFWSNGSAWGTCQIQKDAEWRVCLKVLHGVMTLKSFTLVDQGGWNGQPVTVSEGSPFDINIHCRQEAKESNNVVEYQ